MPCHQSQEKKIVIDELVNFAMLICDLLFYVPYPVASLFIIKGVLSSASARPGPLKLSQLIKGHNPVNNPP